MAEENKDVPDFATCFRLKIKIPQLKAKLSWFEYSPYSVVGQSVMIGDSFFYIIKKAGSFELLKYYAETGSDIKHKTKYIRTETPAPDLSELKPYYRGSIVFFSAQSMAEEILRQRK